MENNEKEYSPVDYKITGNYKSAKKEERPNNLPFYKLVVKLLIVIIFLNLGLLVNIYLKMSELKKINKEIKQINEKQNQELLLFKNSVFEIEGIQNKLRTNYKTKSFQILRCPQRELVQNYQGSYYVIDINDAASRETVKFNVGEYTIQDFNRNFAKSINRFYDEVLKLIQKNVPYKIFVKGSADILGSKTFQRTFHPDYIFNEIRFIKSFKKNVNTRFVPIFEVHRIKEPITNKDLPNLRAAFIREKLKEIFEDKLIDPVILNGDVELAIGHEYRSVTLLLWVDWPNKPVTQIFKDRKMIKDLGGYEWESYPGIIRHEDGTAKVILQLDILSDIYRWKCGSVDEIVRGAIRYDLEKIIKCYKKNGNLKNAKGLICVGLASSEGVKEGEEKRAEARMENLGDLARQHLSEDCPIFGLNLGQYQAGDKSDDCSDKTLWQRRVVLLKITKKANIKDDELVAGVIKMFEYIAKNPHTNVPIDIRKYSKYQDYKAHGSDIITLRHFSEGKFRD